MALVEFAAQRYPDYFKSSLQKLADTELSALQATLDFLPDGWISPAASELAKQMLAIAYRSLTRIAT